MSKRHRLLATRYGQAPVGTTIGEAPPVARTQVDWRHAGHVPPPAQQAVAAAAAPLRDRHQPALCSSGLDDH